ncbi:MAG: methylenetetrahydrofolate--tRNA-(uracil(54)-C(5))-methyltransferase (FADH(2)-oxidizing) TrmFO [Synergistaceae bacterium]|jgi:methylenetetrahydrofolate--tRNA-(uracil-5-)-methyltransferase|nr:methylenetetrahydrofolate--tRNA-(uracil(54)-C(5))-methyltransferase (FADH(2)-oxidizing) TrmFO [Synergistaceae bacterium]
MGNLSAVIVGGGLAGSEAAFQLASRGVKVFLYEMRPYKSTPAHSTGKLAELVCSNSLGADTVSSPAGILKQELRMLDSLVIGCADRAKIPAGKALAVDREIFSGLVTDAIEANGNIEIIHEEATEIPRRAAIIAAGPLMSGGIAEAVENTAGMRLSFFDAAAPIVTLESIDMSRAYLADRYGGGGGDYINCPMDKMRYETFRGALVAAERAVTHKSDEHVEYFEGCLPIEVMAERGMDTMRFGPLRPVGLADPSTGREPYAVVQLRRDNAAGTLYNLVGFQTNLKWPEQDRTFRMIPALENAVFVRHGVMHRNSFVCAPASLDGYLRPASGGAVLRRDLFLAGQITGVEGYVESTAMGLAAALFMHAVLLERALPEFPAATAIGSLLRYLKEAEPSTFQPMNVNLGIFPKLKFPKKLSKPERCAMYAECSRSDMEKFIHN